MQLRVSIFAVALTLSTVRHLTGQTNETRLAFQGAEIQPSAAKTINYMRGGVIRGGRFQVRNATMLDLIALAYNLDAVNAYLFIQGNVNTTSVSESVSLAYATGTSVTATPEPSSLLLLGGGLLALIGRRRRICC